MNHFNIQAIIKQEEIHSVISLYRHTHAKEQCDEIQAELLQHFHYEGFLALKVLDANDQLIGFIYGYTSKPGQADHEQFKTTLNKDLYDQWLHHCFVITGIVIHPTIRRKKIVRYLIEHITNVVRHKTAILTLELSNKKDRNLYKQLGWDLICDHHYPTSIIKPFVIMGKQLQSTPQLTSQA